MAPLSFSRWTDSRQNQKVDKESHSLLHLGTTTLDQGWINKEECCPYSCPNNMVYVLCIFFFFLGLHLQPMEVPKLGVESELQL